MKPTRSVCFIFGVFGEFPSLFFCSTHRGAPAIVLVVLGLGVVIIRQTGNTVKIRIWIGFLVTCLTQQAVQAGFQAEREAVLALGGLTEAPAIADGVAVSAGEVKQIFYDGLDYQGKPTRVFAWVGVPKTASKEKQVPGIVLVHGGGGTAFEPWVRKWTERGYAAISMAVEGQTDQRAPKKPGAKRAAWTRHIWAGPKRVGIYADAHKPLKQQWMYHAVADTILAHSLLRSLPEVDADKVGVMGISWGGIITSTVIGIDHRFAFAIPTYGCGHLSQAANQYGRALGDNLIYQKVWDPMVRIKSVKTPTLWLSWPGDQHFPLDLQATCYGTVSGPHMVSLIPGMGHSHGSGWGAPDSYAFADSVVKTGRPWAKQTASQLRGDRFTVRFDSTKALGKASLIATSDRGLTGQRKWTEHPARLERDGQQWKVTARLPEGTSAWFVNLRSGGLTLSSDYESSASQRPAAESE